MALQAPIRPANPNWLRDLALDKQAHTLFISYDESQAIRQAFTHASIPDCDHELLSNNNFAERLTQCLAPETQQRIEQFGANPLINKLTVRGLPLDHDLPRTPYDGYLPNSSLPLATAIQLGLYGVAGIHPCAFKNENKGRLFRHVVPASGTRDEVSSHGSRRKFGLHVDNPDLPLVPEPVANLSACPEFLSLMAIRSDHQVRSEIAFVDDVLSDLSDGVKRQLQQSEFEIQRPASFGQHKVSTLPLLVLDDTGIAHLRLDTENVTPVTERAAAALLMLKETLMQPDYCMQTVLLPGDFLIVRNQRVLHGRGAFEPRDNGQDRWFVRLFGQSDAQRIVTAQGCPPHIGED